MGSADRSGGGGGDMVLGEGVKRGYSGGMGHRLINEAYWMSHQGLFRTNKCN